MKPFKIATKKTLIKRLESGIVQIDLFSQWLGLQEMKIESLTFPPLRWSNRELKEPARWLCLNPSSKKPINPAPKSPTYYSIKSQKSRLGKAWKNRIIFITVSEIPVIAWIFFLSFFHDNIQVGKSSTVIRPTNLFFELTTGTRFQVIFSHDLCPLLLIHIR